MNNWPTIDSAPKDGNEIWLISVQPQPSGHTYITINNGHWSVYDGCFVLGAKGCKTNSIGHECATHWAPRENNPVAQEVPNPLKQFVLDHYANQDMNHVDFRVRAYELALNTTKHGACEVCGETATLSCGPSRFGPDTWACKTCWNPDETHSS